MSENKLKIAILGLNEGGQLLLKAASGIDYFQIEAVADRDGSVAEKAAAEYKCAAYDDYRQLVIQNQLDCLLVAAGMYSCDEHIRMAIKKNFNILKLAPAGRNFEEAVEFVRLADQEKVKFAVANPYRYAGSFRAFRQFLQGGHLEQAFLITAFSSVREEVYPAWRGDPKLAGGGVLLYDCYRIFDQIMWNFPIPQQVYSVNTSQAADKQQRLYLTEDTALVTMKLTDTLTGSLAAFRGSGIGGQGSGGANREESLSVYGRDKVVTVTARRFTVSDIFGSVIEQSEYDDDEFCCVGKLLKDFALSILLPQENKLCTSARENLKNMAVIEAAYLSARTSMPEQPLRVLQRVQLDQEMFSFDK